MDGGMDRQVEGRMDGWIDGPDMNGWMDGTMAECMAGERRLEK